MEEKKIVTVSFVANKGGVGKSRQAILLAKFLSACGKRVCILDLDDNNSTSYYFLTEKTVGLTKQKNSAKLLSTEESVLSDCTVPTEYSNLFIIPASYYLSDLRTVNERRLSRIVKHSDYFDFVVIDCKPAYDNLTINAINASDFIITPVLQDLDSYNAAVYLRDKIEMDTLKSDNWFITVNGYNKRFKDAITGSQKDYIETYRNSFKGITPDKSWFPWTKDMNKIKDRGLPLSERVIKGCVCNPSLYDAVYNLASCFCDGLGRPDKF